MHLIALLAADEAAKEPQVLAVPVSELIIGIVAFLLVFGFLSRLALPGIKRALDERTALIEGGIAKSEEAQAEAAALKAQYEQLLADARTEAAQIRSAAQADRAAIVEQARTEATEAAAAVTARADAAITAERATTALALQREIGDLAVSLAGKIVGESLSDDERARATIDRFLTDLESTAAEPSR